MRNNMKVYVEYSSGIDGYYLNIRALTALKKDIQTKPCRVSSIIRQGCTEPPQLSNGSYH